MPNLEQEAHIQAKPYSLIKLRREIWDSRWPEFTGESYTQRTLEIYRDATPVFSQVFIVLVRTRGNNP